MRLWREVYAVLRKNLSDSSALGLGHLDPDAGQGGELIEIVNAVCAVQKDDDLVCILRRELAAPSGHSNSLERLRRSPEVCGPVGGWLGFRRVLGRPQGGVGVAFGGHVAPVSVDNCIGAQNHIGVGIEGVRSFFGQSAEGERLFRFAVERVFYQAALVVIVEYDERIIYGAIRQENEFFAGFPASAVPLPDEHGVYGLWAMVFAGAVVIPEIWSVLVIGAKPLESH